MTLSHEAKADALLAWAIYLDTLDESNFRAAMIITDIALSGSSDYSRRIWPDDALDRFACLSVFPKRKKPRARKRKAFKGCIRLDADSAILVQARSLVR